MASEPHDTNTLELKPGQWKHPDPSDLRGPCPIMNSLANHGYIPRDGRNITSGAIYNAFREVFNLAPDAAFGLSKPVFFLHTGEENNPPPPPTENEVPGGFLHGFIKIPALPTLDSQFPTGLRNEGQVNEAGDPVINLDQLSRHGAIEHDVSLTRRDTAQGDNTTIQADLVSRLLLASADGEVFTAQDFAHFRNERLEDQRRDNPELKFDSREKTLAFGEVALFMCVWGASFQGGYDKVPKEYVKAIFAEERIPFEEGWQKRLIPVTLAEFMTNSRYLQGVAAADGIQHGHDQK